MFALSSNNVQPYMRDLLREIGRSLNDVPNHLVVQGHTDAVPYAGGEKGYSNWELSADRANASRRELIQGGMGEAKVLRVLGLASTQNLNKKDPLDPENRRISIIVLNHRAEAAMMREDNAPATTLDNANMQARAPLGQPLLEKVVPPRAAKPSIAAAPAKSLPVAAMPVADLGTVVPVSVAPTLRVAEHAESGSAH
jgi:chemotaxis protein MotB